MPRRRSHARRVPRSNPRGVLAVRKDGYGFVKTPEGDYFVPRAKMNGAADGDYVEVAALPRTRAARGAERDAPRDALGCPAARVVRVVDRAHDVVVGRYEVADPFGVVVPADRRIPYDIFTMRGDRPDIADGAIVSVRIVEFPTRRSAAVGVIEEVLSDADDGSVPIELIVAAHKLETSFSPASLEQAEASRVDVSGALAAGYRDLRDRFVVTVDPADARDFDDALSFERLSSGAWRVGVHIADVSHYVPWGSHVDLDARRRATSVYLVDRVIPMLPEALSNGTCSLSAGEDRRAMTVDVVLDDAARVLSFEAYPSLVRSRRRLTYGEALGILNGDDARDGDARVTELLRGLSRVAKLRARARARAGGMDFDTVEAKVRLDGEGAPEEIVLRQRNDATELVEEAMILANETVARCLRDAGVPCMYRVHEKPSPDSLKALVPVLQEFPWFEQIDRRLFVAGNPFEVQRALSLAEGRLEGRLVSSLVLRSMKRADYRVACEGHYGLASEAYAHFTSPIRRYPDLVVHRMLKARLFGRGERFDQEVSAMPWLAEHSSKMERVADEAARESQEVKMIEYLTRFIGQEFSGVVSGVATYGVFVRLDNTAEGLLPTSELGRECFALDAARWRLVGQESGAVYGLGQRVRVVLTAADASARQLDFRLAR